MPVNPEIVNRVLSWADVSQIIRYGIPYFDYLEVDFATADFFTVGGA